MRGACTCASTRGPTARPGWRTSRPWRAPWRTPRNGWPRTDRSSVDRALGRFDRARDVHARAGVELAEHVSDVRLDGLLAEEQLARDLAVGLAVDDQPGDLELSLCQRADATLTVAGSSAAVNVLTQLAKFAL